MNDDVIFTIKLLLVLIAAVACMAPTSQAEEWLSVKIVQARGGLNVRTDPNAEAKPVYLLEDTETVLVLEERDGWTLVAKNISPDMVLGWVCGKYLK